jgi:hypothetical protein
VQDIENVGNERGVSRLMPRHCLQQRPCPVSVGEGKGVFCRLVRRALVAELVVGEGG